MLFLSWLHRLRWPATIRQPSSKRPSRQRKLQEGILALTAEGLEARQVLTGTVVVNTFNDLPDADLLDGVADADLGTTGLQTSLRAAVMHANATAGLETIVLSAGTYQLTIDGNGENNSESGDLDLFSDIEIIGAGSQNTTIEMGFAGGIGPAIQDRVFDIFGASKVLIQGVKIQKGQTVDFGEVGGGVRANSDVELRNVILTNNQTGLNGGGLSVGFVGSVTLVGSTVTSNSAVFNGGGISSQGTLKVYDSSVTNNTTGANGGGIASAGSLEVIRSLIQGNVANTNGGGIDSNSGSATIIGSTIKSNVATNGRGGGLNLSSGDTMPGSINADIQFSEISDNTAQRGGGILMNSSGMLSLRNSTLADNTAAGTATVGGQAGGLLQLAGKVIVSDSTFSGNSANSLAGATDSEGGGVFHQGGELSFVNATIANNSAKTGGGLASRAVGDPSKNRVSLRNTIVATNSATVSNPDLVAFTSPLFSNGHNLIGVGISPFVNNINGDQVGTIASPVNPQLAPLGNYGGGTRTQKLNAGSPAIDAGSNLGVSGSDQRGVPRILNGGTSNTADIGAVEAGFTGFFVDTEVDSTDINPGDGVAIDAAGKTSLRAAIQEANALAGLQTIVVPAGNYRLTLNGAFENAAAIGDLDITQSVNIRGAGGAATIIDGNFSDRVFDIFPGATTTISGLSITNGLRPLNGGVNEARGGGLRINSAPVVLERVTVTNNVASDFGGGLYNESSGSGGGLTIRNSTFLSNQSEGGGAIHNSEDTLTIEDSLFEFNRTAFGGSGGALQHSGPGTINNSRFSHNSTFFDGGGAIAIFQGAAPATTTISHSEISYNSAVGGAGNGGGIDVSFDTLVLSDSVVSNNTSANAGGGLLVSNGTLTVLRSSVNGNIVASATGFGGGIASAGGTLQVVDSQINSNTVTGAVGPLFFGGGLGLDLSSTTTLLRSTISRNMATVGGGIHNQGTLTIENSTISQNNTSGNGGGLFDSGTTTISSSTFSTNTAAMGGGIFAANAGARSLINTIVAGNFSTTDHDADLSGTSFTTNGNNLIGDIDAAVGLVSQSNGDIVGGDAGTALDSVSGNTTSPIVVTLADHGLLTGDRIRIVGVTGNTAANGTFTITLIDANQFSLNNSVHNGDYGGGGDFFFLIDPRLGPLANNTNPFAVNPNQGPINGPPQVVVLQPQTPETHALLLESPAIDRGNDSGSPTTDQRGFARINVAGVGVNGVSTDIGAVELFHTTASGLVFSDLNGNGLRDVNEQGRGGVTVYLDSNANGSLDPDEPFASTAFFDNPLTPEIEEVGSYTLTFIPPGTQVISELLPFNARQTTGLTPPRFSTATEIATGADPSSVITGDFNNDGTTDVAFVQTSANLLTIVPRMPDGSWETPISFTVGSTPKEVVAGDLNGDGRLDLVVVNKDSNNLSVFFSNATGFNAVQNFAVGTSPRAIVLADLDHDGDLDIAVANEGSDDVSLLQQTSSGVFTTLPAVSVGDGPRDIIATDFDNDGQIDLVTADKLSNEISLLRNDNSGITFTRTAINVSGTLPSSLLAEDVDRDGDVDLVFGAVGTGEVLLLENSGTGMFGPPVALLSGVDPTSLGSADVDLDGDADLFVPNESASGTITVLVNDNGAFPNSFVFATGSQPASIAFADFNSDGRHDLITANIGGDNLTVLSNLTGSYSVTAVTGTPLSNRDFGNQDFATVTGTIFNDFNSNGLQDRSESGIGGVPVFLDMNGNGRKDSFEPQTTTSTAGAFGGLAGGYLFQGLLPGKYRVYQMPKSGFVQTAPRNVSFDEGLSVPSGNFISDVIATDLNKDGMMDVVSLSREVSGNGLVHIFLGTANGPGSEIVVAVGSQPKRVQAADLDHDGDLDLFVLNSGNNTVSIIRNDAGMFSALDALELSQPINDLAVGDINGDGDADIVVSETVTNFSDSVELFLSMGDLTFHQSSMNLGNNDTSGIALADLDNDHDLDLVAVDRMNGRVRLFANIEMDFFIPAGDFLTDPAPGAVVVGYFNGDAIPDIAVASQANNAVATYSSTAPFVYSLSGVLPTPALVSDLVVADVNRDGLDDLVLTTADGRLIVAQGTLNGLFQSQTEATFLSGTTGSALAFGDFNDGKLLDVIIGQDVAAVSLTLGLNRLFGAVVDLVPGGFTNVNFGSVELGTIQGRIFLDTNANGVPDPGEDDGFGGIRVFVDLNRNGRFEPQEPFAVTGVDGGIFSINDVMPNQSLVVVAEPLPGTLRTGPFGLQYGPPALTTISSPRSQFVSDLIAVADLNFDGAPELIAINPDAGNLTVTSLVSNSPTTLTYGVGTTPTFLRVGRLNNNSIPDIVVANNGSNSLTIFLDGNMASPLTVTGINNPRAIELIDIDGDNDLDVIATSSSSGNVTILANDGLGTLTVSSVLTVTGADSGEDIARADIDGDGDQDLIFIDASSDTAFVLRNNSDGTLTHIGTINTGDNPVSLDSADDFDADADQDFVLTAAGDKTIQVLLNDGSGSFTAVTKATLADTPGAIDFNAQSHRIAVTLPNRTVLTVFAVHPDGTLSPAGFVATTGGQDSVLLADLNKDGKDDLISTAFNNGKLNINDDWTSPISGTYEVRLKPGETLADLVFGTQDLRSTAIILNGNDLQIDDILGGNSDDNWSLTMDGSSVKLHSNNPNELLTSGIAGATGEGTDSLTIPLSAFSGGIIFNGGAGADTLTLNVIAGFSRSITFNGGAPTSGSGDTLVLQSAGTFDSATYSFDDASSGSVQFSGNGLINYTGLEPVISSVATEDVTLQFSSASETILFSGAGPSQTTVDSTAGESLTFLNPTKSLIVMTGQGDDTIDVGGLGQGFNAALTIDAEVGTDTILLGTSLQLGSATSTGDLTLTAEAISLNAASIATNGNITNNTAGAVTLNGAITLSTGVTINTDSSSTRDGAVFVETVDGAHSLTITSGSATTTLNNFVGATIALSDLDVTAAVIAINSDLRADGGSLTFNGDTRLGTDLLIDTEQGDDNAVGSVTFSNGSVSAVGTIHSLTINTSTSGSNNSGAVTLNSVGNAAGQFLSSLTINATNAGSGTAGDVTFTNGITLENDGSFDASGRTISLSTTNSDVVTSGTGSVTLTATRDITLSSGASIQTVNGDLSLNANQQTTATTGKFVGIRLDNATLQTSGSGNIALLGRGGDANSFNHGIVLENGAKIRSTDSGVSAGTISLTGNGGGGSSDNVGVMLIGTGTDIESVDGSISLNGTGGNGTGDRNDGVDVRDGAAIRSTGTVATAASITIMGTAGAGVRDNDAVQISGSGSLVISKAGNIEITGTGGASTGDSNDGVILLDGGQVISTGTGANVATITINGTGGDGTDGNNGIVIEGTDALVRSVEGTISLTGAGGTGSDGFHRGIFLTNGGHIESTGTGANAADITLDGTGGVGNGDGSRGIQMQTAATMISTVDGDVRLTGNGGSGTGFNQGIMQFGGTITSTGTTAGAGKITLIGSGGSGTGGHDTGVFMFDNEAILMTSHADISVVGIGGGTTASSGNWGIEASGIISAGGAGVANLTGTGGSGSGGDNVGLSASSNAKISTTGGALNLFGTNGSGSASPAFRTSTSGTVTITTDLTGAINITADSIKIGSNTTLRAGDAGSGSLTILQQTNGVAFNLGSTTDNAASTIELSDAELDHITANTINLGNANSGVITVSNAISRPSATNLILTAGSNKDVSFSGGTAGLNANGGNVSLINSGTGSITSGSAPNDIIANRVSLTSGSGGIGLSGNPLNFDANQLVTSSSGNADQFINEAGSVLIDAAGLTAGTGTIQFSGGAFTLNGSDRIADSTVLQVPSGATVKLNGFLETVAGLTGNGSVLNGSATAGSLTLNSSNNTTFDGVLGGATANDKKFSLNKSGTGTLTLTGTNTFTGLTTIDAGKLLLNGSLTSDVIVASSGTFGGSGTIGGGHTLTVNNGGTLAPGNSPGIVNSGSVTFNSGSIFSVELNGTTVGTGYDQLNVTGTVDLNGATLDAILGFTPAAGATFVIVNNDGSDAINGTFGSLSQGALLTIAGKKFHIYYDFDNGGGQNNDVALIVNRAPQFNAQTFNFNENSANNTAVGTAVASDADGGSLNYAITAGNTSNAFAMNATTGAIRVNNAAAIDFETNPVFSLTVDVTDDAGAVTTKTITINLNDLQSNLSINNASTSEGDSGTKTLTFNVKSSAVINNAFTIDFNTSKATAGDGLLGSDTDFVANSGTLNFAGNAANESKTVTIIINGDTVIEGDETFNVLLSNLLGTNDVTITTATGAGTITNDDSSTLTISSPTITEGDSGTTTMTFTVTSPKAVEGGFTVAFNVSDITTNSSDYTVVTSSPLTFSGTANETQTITININGDTIIEGDETFSITLGTVTPVAPVAAASITSGATGTGTITNNDTSTLTISSPTITEGNSGTTTMTFTVTSPKAVEGGFTVAFSATDITANASDYTVVTSSPLTFSGTANETKTITVNINGDAVIEGDETFSITLGTVTPVAPVAAASFTSGAIGTGTITNNDTSTLGISSPSITEANSGTTTMTFTFTVTSPKAVEGGFTVSFDVADITTNGSDYTVVTSSPLTFSGTENETKTITINVNGDAVIEGDETFSITLGTVTPVAPVDAASITTGAVGTGTITNNDTSTLTISSPTITEANSGTTTMTFTVTSPSAVEGGFTVAFNVADITTNGSDYTVVTRSPLTFSGTANETQTITININGDTIIEGNETLSITLETVTPVAPVAAASITSGATGTGTITNNDTSTLTISSPTITEGDSGVTTMTFTVTSPNAVDGGFTVPFDVANVTAISSDYTVITSSPLTFSGTANETKTITINVNGDAVIEGDETFTITLGVVTPIAPVAAASITSGAVGTGTITNNDTSTLAISSPTITEANSGTTTMTFTITSPKAVEGGFTVPFDVTNVTTNGSDYTVVTSSPLTFSGTANETKTITINVGGDTLIEGDESFTITLGVVTPVAPVAAASITSDAIGTGTIANNDTSTLAISNPTITEGNSGITTMTFTVTSPRAVEGGFTVAFDVADITTNGSDYTVVTSSPLTFSGTANETRTITVNVNGDTVIEGDETFSITLGTVTPVAPVADTSITIGAVGTGTITNNDTSTLTISSPTVTEGDSGTTTMTFTVTSPKAVEGGFTVAFSVADITTNNSDYTVVTNSPLTFTGTANETQTITININGDDLAEATETLSVTLGTVTPVAPVAAASISSDASGTGTITNDDFAPVANSGGPYRINEGSGLPLNASGTTDADTPGSNLTYLWDIDGDGQFTENITGASPILAVSDLVTLGLSNGLRRNNVTVQVGDGTNISTASTQLTINNLPPSPPVDLLADAVDHVVDGSPNGTTVGIQVLSTDPGNDSVTYRFTDNAGGRFAINASTGVITIANSLLLNSQVSSSHTVTVVATDSDFADSQPVSFTIEVQPAPPPTASVTPDTAYVIEGDSGFVYVVFAVRLSTPSVLPIDINFTTLLSSEPDAARDTDDPADANNPRDFYLTTGTIHFNPFSTEELIRIQIQPDLIAEMDETFLIQLTAATNADLSGGSPVSSAIIRDDDTVPQFIVSAPSFLEGDPASGTPNELVYTLTVSGRFDSTGHASLHFATGVIGDTASSGVDYTTTFGDLDFSESQRTILVRVPIIGDLTDEADETVSLTFSDVSGLGIPVTPTTGTIINDDSPNPVLQINSQVIREGTGFNSTAIFTVTLIGKPIGPVNVNYNTLDETATAGSDYVAANGTLTFLPGGPVTQSIPVTIIGDSLPESAKETFALTLSSANNATVDSQLGIGSGSILDDDGNVITSEADQVAAELTAIFNQFGGDKNNPELVAALLNAAAGIATRLGFLKALVIVIDPVDFILNDTQGRQSGFTESTGVINQIPGTYYSGNGPVELLIVPLPPDGVYNLQLAGLGGPFNAAIAVTIGGETQTTSVSSSLENGSNLQVSINVGGTVPNSPFTLTIPVGLGLGGQPGNGNATFGVVGANDRFARRDFEAEESEERQSDAEMTLDESNDSPFDQLVNWIMIAKSTREKLVRQLFESLDLPFGNLLEPDSGAEQKLTDELVDLFWKRLGQTLTGVPAGAYKLGDMLENLLPQNALRPSKKTPAEQGKGEPGTNGKSTPKTKRSTETRQRSAPRSGEKMKSDANQQRSQTEPKEALTAQLADSEAAAKPQQTESTLVAFWNWLSSSSRRS